MAIKYSLNLDPETVRDIKELKVERGDLSRVVVDYISQRKFFAGGSIDSVPADNGRTKSQDNWIPYFNERGEIFAAAPDVVRAAYSPESLLKSLRKDFDKRWLTTSTRPSYAPNDLVAKITHYFGSTVTVRKPVEHSGIIVPILQGESLCDVRDNKQVSAYLKVLTGLKGKALIDGLERLSGMPAEKIILWTPTQDSRKDFSERVASFICDSGRFLVGGGWLDNGDIGRARRVLDVSEQAAQKKAA